MVLGYRIREANARRGVSLIGGERKIALLSRLRVLRAGFNLNSDVA
jgi:hypothetical protein